MSAEIRNITNRIQKLINKIDNAGLHEDTWRDDDDAYLERANVAGRCCKDARIYLLKALDAYQCAVENYTEFELKEYYKKCIKQIEDVLKVAERGIG